MEEYFTAELERRIEECEEQQHEVLEKALKESRQHHEALIQVEQKKAQEANICAEVYVFKYNAEFTRRSSQKEPSEVPGATKTPKSKENLNVFDFMERPEKNSSLASSHEAETGSEIDDITTESELLENKWGERDPYMHSMPRPGPRRWPARTCSYLTPHSLQLRQDERNQAFLAPHGRGRAWDLGKEVQMMGVQYPHLCGWGGSVSREGVGADAVRGSGSRREDRISLTEGKSDFLDCLSLLPS